MEQDFEMARGRMAEKHLIGRGIKSGAVLGAMLGVPRHLFVPEYLQCRAYDDAPLPIGLGQTISQPYIVALMTERLEPALGMKVLEIGTGSGYQAAILAHLGCDVYTVELLEELAARAKIALSALKFDNVKAKCGNGYMGWPEEAPFDAIIVTAAPEKMPKGLVGQLKEGGRMMIPVGPSRSTQLLKLVLKKANGATEEDLLAVRFVPMVGRAKSGGGRQPIQRYFGML